MVGHLQWSRDHPPLDRTTTPGGGAVVVCYS